ncbi:hypothetical protein I302_101708 [Kwoniella bestiolae CBS 10118]|uniref:Maintenance of mitochondrial morphology protein 1 n=1 Tax=Kwoniella bestiolae CBS 10118 TaxID=1296100 RepID=A0A1B9GCZ5_9TREE|nr:mitochondrial outer membrane protein [Kwoniella bestiolae CBS 10118]OCF28894.1 mitochondrial outer membrane protein [Kwoniella bestiolae CBS 10118]
MSAPPLPPSLAPIPPPTSSWTFTQGFILGQASFLIIVLLFVRYVVFSPSEEIDAEGWKQRRAEKAKKALLSTTSVPPPPPAQLLQKTNYEMATHAAESTDWVNVLLAQMLQGYRNDLLSANGEEGARQRIEKWLNPTGKNLSWLDPIEVTSLSLGKAYPLLSNARIRPADGQGRIRAEIDVDYLDSISLSLSTAVLVNFPRPRFAVLPVSLGVELVSIGGTLSVQLHEPVDERQHIHVSLLPDFHLNLKTTSLLGSRAKLQDIPKLEQLILSRIRSIIQDRFVYPAHLSLALPRILSPSVSPTPLLNDLGESAVNAMSEAMSQGISRMVNDMMGPGNSPSMDNTTVDEAVDEGMYEPVDEIALSRARQLDREEGMITPSAPSSRDGFARAERGDRKIPIPPNLASTTSKIEQPIPRRPPYLSTQTSRPNSPSITSSYRQIPEPIPTPTAAGTPNNNQFRFRGQFASNPPTPGADGLGTMQGHAGRKLGVFNSTARG